VLSASKIIIYYFSTAAQGSENTLPCTNILNTVHVSSVNDPHFFQSLDHAVHRGDPHGGILFPYVIIDFLTAGALMLQYESDEQFPLFGFLLLKIAAQ
jgi:hypothetical protein